MLAQHIDCKHSTGGANYSIVCTARFESSSTVGASAFESRSSTADRYGCPHMNTPVENMYANADSGYHTRPLLKNIRSIQYLVNKKKSRHFHAMVHFQLFTDLKFCLLACSKINILTTQGPFFEYYQ